MKRTFLLLSIIVSTTFGLFAQEKLEIRLVPTNVSESADVLCFDTQFKNISDHNIVLADQNYRMFYDALQLKLIDGRMKSFLPKTSYEEIDLNQSLHNIDARGYGDLKFGQNLGFINYTIKMTDEKDDAITLPAFSPWMSTSNLCFQANDVMGPVNIVWAREGLTSGYATAFTEISSFDKNQDNSPVLIQIYQDFIKLSDGTGVNDPMVLQSTQNH